MNNLRPYQLEDVEKLKTINGKGVFNEQRTGKTPTVLSTLKACNQQRNLIIVPKSTLYSWKAEYEKWHGGNCEIVTGRPAQRKKLYQEHNGTLIITPDLARNDLILLTSICKSFDAIVLDEAHILKNFKGTRARKQQATSLALVALRKISTDAYALSGTPSPNYAYNIFGILSFLHPKTFDSYWNYINHYFGTTEKIYNRQGDKCTYINTTFKTQELEQQHLDLLDNITVQRKRKDVMEWIPPVDIRTIRLQLPEKLKLLYTELGKFFEIQEYDVIVTSVLEQMLRMRQLLTLPMTLGIDHIGPKMEWILDFINDYPEKPIVITSFFTSALKLIKEKILPDALILTGETPKEERAKIIDAFNKRENTVLLLNIDVGKVGISLWRAEAIIFLDPSLTYADNEQMKDRLIPTLQSQTLLKDGQEVIFLQIEDTYDTKLAEALEAKRESSDLINDFKQYIKENYGHDTQETSKMSSRITELKLNKIRTQ